MSKFHRVTSSALSLALMLSMMPSTVLASEVSSMVNLNIEGIQPEIASLIVPATINLKMDSDGNVETDGDVIIQNNNNQQDLEITGISSTGENGWEPVDFNDDFSAKSNNTKEYSFRINGDPMDSQGEFSLTPGNWVIEASDEMELDVEAKIPLQTESSDEEIAKISFSFELLDNQASQVTNLSVDYVNGLMLPGSENNAVFSWDNSNVTLDEVVSSDDDIVTVSINNNQSGTSASITVTGVSRGTATITGILSDGTEETFEVQISEQVGGSNPTGSVVSTGEFSAGDTLTPEDIEISIPVVLPDGSNDIVTVTPTEEDLEGIVLQDGDNSVEVTVTVNNINITVIINIYVTPAVDPSTVVNTISIETMPDTTDYNIGSNFDSTGLSIRVTYQDNSSSVITSGYTLQNNESLSANQDTIIVEYKGKTCEVPITVSDWSVILESISVSKNPDKTTYTVGDNFDSTGLELLLTYKDNHTSTTDTGFTIVDGTSLVESQTTVTVEYEGKTCELDIEVNPDNEPYLGESHNGVIPAGGVYYSNNTTEYLGDYNGRKYVAGESFPSTPKLGDVYIYGDYEYRYGGEPSYHWESNEGEWYIDEYNLEESHWGVDVLDNSKSSYGEVLGEINGQPVDWLAFTFDQCTNMTESPRITDRVLSLRGAFSGCEKLLEAPKIPSGIYGFELAAAFEDCKSMTKVGKLPSGVTSLSDTFDGCESLIEAPEIPSNVTRLYGTFDGCKSLIEAPEIPSNVTDMTYAFQGCTSLTKVPKIPSTVTSLMNTFNGCTGLTDANDMVIPAGVKTVQLLFSGSTKLSGTITINANNISNCTHTFQDCSTDPSASLIVKGTAPNLDAIIATKSANSNITKG